MVFLKNVNRVHHGALIRNYCTIHRTLCIDPSEKEKKIGMHGVTETVDAKTRRRQLTMHAYAVARLLSTWSPDKAGRVRSINKIVYVSRCQLRQVNIMLSRLPMDVCINHKPIEAAESSVLIKQIKYGQVRR